MGIDSAIELADAEEKECKDGGGMPRRRKNQKHTITVVLNGTPVAVILHPPSGTRSCWYAYWNGLVASRSTGQRRLEDAIVAAETW